MEEKIKVELTNIENSVLVSDIIKDLSRVLDSKGDNYQMNKSNIDGTKGEIITGIIIGLTVNAITELVKVIIKKYSKREDFNSSTKIQINEIVINIGEINNYQNPND